MSARERLQVVLERTGLAAKKSLGQNFLVSDVVIERILKSARTPEPKAFIEVGPGPGALTDGLRSFGFPIKLIELDRVMAEYWRAEGLEVIEADALQLDWSSLAPLDGTVLVSNLPYQISSSLVIDRSIEGPPQIQRMVLMFQKEVAQRIRAQASTEAYGLLTVIAQNFWEIEMVTEAGPKDFWPPPKVASRVLSFRRRQEATENPAKFLVFVKAAFAQRRKLLKSNLSGWMGSRRVDSQKLLAKLAEFGLKETARAEELSPVQFRELYEHLDRPRE